MSDDYTIKPQASTPAVDTSEWPLLLKNFDNCAYREKRGDVE